MTLAQTDTTDKYVTAALDSIKDPTVRASAIAFVAALQSAVTDALSVAEKIKNDPEAMAIIAKELES